MGSLKHCLSTHNCPAPLAKLIRKTQKEYLDDGYLGQEATVKAVKDVMGQLETQRSNIVKQVNKQISEKHPDLVPVKEHPAITQVRKESKENVQQVDDDSEQGKAVVEMAKKFKKKIVFFTGSTKANGFFNANYGDTLFVNADSPDMMLFTFGHELTHALKNDDPDLYVKLFQALYGHVGNFDSYMEKANANRKSKGLDELSPVEMAEEFFADFSGDQFTDPKFWSKLLETDKTLFDKVAELFNKIVSKLETMTGFRSDEHFRAINKAQKALAGVLDDYANSVEHKTAVAGVIKPNAVVDQSGDSVSPRYSLRTWTPDEKALVIDTAKKLNIPVKKAQQWIRDIDSVMARVINNPDLDFNAESADLFDALKKNSDPHYTLSLDFSTLCRKRYVLAATIEAIQVQLGQAVTKENWVQIRGMLEKKGLPVSCGACYVDSKRMEEGKQINKFIALHPELNPASVLTQRGVDKLRKENPELYKEYKSYAGRNNSKTSESRTDYKGEIRKIFIEGLSYAKQTPTGQYIWGTKENKEKAAKLVKQFNDRSGLRWQSWSDFELVHLMDAMQAILDMSQAGLQGHAYTKVPEFVEAMGHTGLMINMSLIPKGSGLDSNGELIFDDIEGMPFDKAMALREKFPETAGTIAIGVSNEHILKMMADPRIDMIIPYHASGLSKDIATAFKMDEWSDFTKTQTEDIADYNLFHERIGKGNAKLDALVENGEVTDQKEYRRIAKAAGLVGIDFVDYWSDKRPAKTNTDLYLKLCKENGIAPMFRGYKFKDRSLADFTKDKNYFKILIDRKSFNNDGKNIIQAPVEPKYDNAALNGLLDNYEPAQTEADQETVESFMAEAKPAKTSFSTKQLKAQVGSNSTQVATTSSMYEKAVKMLKGKFPNARTVLDYGAGLGKGTDAMRKAAPTMQIESFEPLPDRWAGERPVDYSKVEDIDKKYDLIVNTNVMNVLEPDLREAVLSDIASKLSENGAALITARGWKGDVNSAKYSRPAEEQKAIWIKKRVKGKTVEVYQKGFDGNELQDYAQKILGNSFTVNKVSGYGKTAVIVENKPNGVTKFSIKEAEKLQSLAEEHKPHYLDTIKKVATSVAGKIPEGSEAFAVKSNTTRIAEKYARGTTKGKPKNQRVTDVLRATILTTDPSKKLNRILRELRKEGYYVLKTNGEQLDIDDLYADQSKGGYRHVAIKLVKETQSDPLVRELLVMTKNMFWAKEKFVGHKLYEISRTLQDAYDDNIMTGKEAEAYQQIKAYSNWLYALAHKEDLNDSTKALFSSESAPYGANNNNASIGGISPDAFMSVLRSMLNSLSAPTIAKLSSLSNDAAAFESAFESLMGRPLNVDGGIAKSVTEGNSNIGPKEDKSNKNKFSVAQTETPAFKKWFGNSQVVNEKGEPLVVYHGTNESFNEFKKTDMFGMKGQQFGEGYYFATNKKTTKIFGKKVISAYLKADNLFDSDNAKSFDDVYTAANKKMPFNVKRLVNGGNLNTALRRMLETDKNILVENGYDGVVGKSEFGGKEYIVFKPNQIKSATENVGTFDANNNDIRYSVANLKKWRGRAKLVKDPANHTFKDGEPVSLMGYHGTTHEFEIFDSNLRGNPQNDVGQGNYLTTAPTDAGDNYHETGADLQARVAERAEQILNEIENDSNYAPDMTPEEWDLFDEDKFAEVSRMIAERELIGDSPKTMNLHIRFDNPAVLGDNWAANNQTQFELGYDKEGELDLEDENSSGAKLISALEELTYDYPELDLHRIASELYDGMSLAQLKEDLESMYIEDPLTGMYAPGDVLAKALQIMGYDGIIYQDASKNFPGMGLAPGTVHAVNWDSRNIKSQDENNGEYDRNNPNIKYSAEGDRVRREVFNAEDRTPVGKIANFVKDIFTKERNGEDGSHWLDKARTGLIDKYHPISRYLGQDIYKLHRMLNNAANTVGAFLTNGPLSWDNGALTVKTKNKGFAKWLHEEVGDESKRFLSWVAAKRAELLDEQDRENWFTEDKRNVIFKEAEDAGMTEKYEKWNKKLQEYNSNVIDIAVEAGLIDPEARKNWMSQYYLPFYRLLEDPETAESFLKAPVSSKKFISSGIKTLKGGESQLGDPLENMIQNWSHLISESQRQVARQSASELMLSLGMAEEMKAGALVKVLGTSSVFGVRFANGDGKINWRDFDGMTRKEVLKAIDGVEGAQLIERQILNTVRKDEFNIMSFMRNGKQVYLKVDDSDLYNALTQVNTKTLNNGLITGMGWFKRSLTYGATFGVGFRVANLLRDTIQTAVISKSFLPVVDSFKGVLQVMRKSDDYIALMASGGGFGQGWLNSGDPKALSKSIHKLSKEAKKGVNKMTVLNSPKKLLHLWEAIGHASEMAARVQLYTNLKAEGKTHMEAAYEARDLLDFASSGSCTAVRVLTAVTPFTNARLQGLDRLARGAINDPRTFIIRGALVATASLALWAAYRDDDRYKELEDWQKWQYHHFWIGDEHYAIPKAFETGAIFSTLFESMGNVAVGNEDMGYFADMLLHTITSTFAISPPTVFTPIGEIATNKSWFTGRKLESSYMEKLEPGMRANVWDSSTLKALGKTLNISPIKMKTIIRDYTGTVGTGLLTVADYMTEYAQGAKTPQKTFAEYTGLDRFMRTRVSNTKYATRYYEFADEVNTLFNTINAATNTGDFEYAMDKINGHPDYKARKSFINSVNRQLMNIRKQEKLIYLNNSMSKAAKRTQLDILTKRKNKIYKGAYETIKGFKK